MTKVQLIKRLSKYHTTYINTSRFWSMDKDKLMDVLECFRRGEDYHKNHSRFVLVCEHKYHD